MRLYPKQNKNSNISYSIAAPTILSAYQSNQPGGYNVTVGDCHGINDMPTLKQAVYHSLLLIGLCNARLVRMLMQTQSKSPAGSQRRRVKLTFVKNINIVDPL